jgi:hypothetical protein
MDQYYYFGVLPTAMDDSVYRGIVREAVDTNSNDMRTKGKVD